MRVAIMSMVGSVEQWMQEHCTHAEIAVQVSLQGEVEGTIPLERLTARDDWGYLLIFTVVEQEKLCEKIRRLTELYGIPKERVIFPLDEVSLANHSAAAYYLFDAGIQRLVEYAQFYKRQSFSFAEVEQGICYVGRGTDLVIMKEMYVTGRNWADEDIRRFYWLAHQYYTFSEEQTLFCDIGANIGTTCIYFKKIIDPDISILAFEPMPDTFRLLSTNMNLNNIEKSDVRLLNMGISDRNERKMINYNLTNPGGSSFFAGSREGVEFEAQTTTFDSSLEREYIMPSQIKYIWVDVEGYEWAFLSGAKGTLQMIDVPIVMEVTPWLLREQKKDEQYLADVKELYTRYIVMNDPEGVVHPVDEIEDLLIQNEQKDVFFLK